MTPTKVILPDGSSFEIDAVGDAVRVRAEFTNGPVSRLEFELPAEAADGLGTMLRGWARTASQVPA